MAKYKFIWYLKKLELVLYLIYIYSYIKSSSMKGCKLLLLIFNQPDLKLIWYNLIQNQFNINKKKASYLFNVHDLLLGGTCGVMVVFIESGFGYTSLKPKGGCLHFK